MLKEDRGWTEITRKVSSCSCLECDKVIPAGMEHALIIGRYKKVRLCIGCNNAWDEFMRPSESKLYNFGHLEAEIEKLVAAHPYLLPDVFVKKWCPRALYTRRLRESDGQPDLVFQ